MVQIKKTVSTTDLQRCGAVRILIPLHWEWKSTPSNTEHMHNPGPSIPTLTGILYCNACKCAPKHKPEAHGTDIHKNWKKFKYPSTVA